MYTPNIYCIAYRLFFRTVICLPPSLPLTSLLLTLARALAACGISDPERALRPCKDCILWTLVACTRNPILLVPAPEIFSPDGIRFNGGFDHFRPTDFLFFRKWLWCLVLASCQKELELALLGFFCMSSSSTEGVLNLRERYMPVPVSGYALLRLWVRI